MTLWIECPPFEIDELLIQFHLKVILFVYKNALLKDDTTMWTGMLEAGMISGSFQKYTPDPK